GHGPRAASAAAGGAGRPRAAANASSLRVFLRRPGGRRRRRRGLAANPREQGEGPLRGIGGAFGGAGGAVRSGASVRGLIALGGGAGLAAGLRGLDVRGVVLDVLVVVVVVHVRAVVSPRRRRRLRVTGSRPRARATRTPSAAAAAARRPRAVGRRLGGVGPGRGQGHRRLRDGRGGGSGRTRGRSRGLPAGGQGGRAGAGPGAEVLDDVAPRLLVTAQGHDPLALRLFEEVAEGPEAVIGLVEGRLLALHGLLDHGAPQHFLVLALQSEHGVHEQGE